MTFQDHVRNAATTARSVFTDDFARGTVFVIVIVTVCYLAVVGKDVPQDLTTVLGIVIGFYFGVGVTNGKQS